MSSIIIKDLAASQDLGRGAMARVKGGSIWASGVNVNIDVRQQIGQFQDVRVNVLNGNGIIGAGFQAPSLAVSPTQWATNTATIPGF